MGTQEGRSPSRDIVFRGASCAEEALSADPILHEYYAAISPDSQSVVFVRGVPDDSHNELVTKSITTGVESVLLVSQSDIGDPRWSPDGTRLAFWRFTPDGYTSIWIIDVRTGEAVALTPADAIRSRPRWSPDGEEVSMVRSDERGSRIEIMSLSDGTVRELATGPGDHSMSEWSPDGSQLSVVDINKQSLLIYDLNIDGVNKEIDLSRAEALDLTWDTEGILVGFSGSRTNSWDLVSIDPETNEKTLHPEGHFGQSLLNARQDLK